MLFLVREFREFRITKKEVQNFEFSKFETFLSFEEFQVMSSLKIC